MRYKDKTVDEIYEIAYPRAKLKLDQARYIAWPRRNQVLPSGEGTWRSWWESTWQDNLERYRAEIRNDSGKSLRGDGHAPEVAADNPPDP